MPSLYNPTQKYLVNYLAEIGLQNIVHFGQLLIHTRQLKHTSSNSALYKQISAFVCILLKIINPQNHFLV